MSIPRSEYPRPQMRREAWLCLNGEWEFEMDPGDSGLERGLVERPLEQRITVPFCPESPLSGIGHTDFIGCVWYRRTVDIPADWKDQRVLLHFQAVDYDATVWVNGQEAGRHRGGFAPFTCDITRHASPGSKATIVVRARDWHKPTKPMGKQSTRYENYACFYPRTTGIWQTVWLEPTPPVYLKRPRITPDVAQGAFHLVQPMSSVPAGHTLRARLSDGGRRVAEASVALGHDAAPQLRLDIPEDKRVLWRPGAPHLYDLEIALLDGQGNTADRIVSYAGLRSLAIRGKEILLNGRPVFQRLVLDQGYYPDGIMTAPSEEALIRDIELGFEAGFNGARLHQKVFEERFLYHADRLGYLVWGEFPDWGCRGDGHWDDHQKPGPEYIAQWLEVIERDYSHPAIVGWCPLNETFQRMHDHHTQLDDATLGMYLATKALDPNRPVVDASGYAHRVAQTDVYDSHDYDQNPESFAARHNGILEGKPYINELRGEAMSLPYAGQPYFVSEFGGIWWNPDAKEGEDSWGYGERPRGIEEFHARFEGLCSALLGNPMMFGYCYTQLTDVYQEQNGIYTFDRREKFDMERIRRVQQQVAAIEKDPVE